MRALPASPTIARMNDRLPDPGLDRPELQPAAGGLQHLRNLACFGGILYLVVQALWSAVAPLPTITSAVALWVVALAVVWGFGDFRRVFTSTATFELPSDHRSVRALCASCGGVRR